MSKHDSMALYPLARAAEMLAFYESPGAPEFPGAQPTIRINAEDFANLLADLRVSLTTHAQLVEALEVIKQFSSDPTAAGVADRALAAAKGDA